MADSTYQIQLDFSKAEKQWKQFKSKMEKGLDGSKPKVTNPQKQMDKQLKAEQKAAAQLQKQKDKALQDEFKKQQSSTDKISQQKQKALQDELKAQQKAATSLDKQKQKALQDQLKEQEKASEQEAKAQEKAWDKLQKQKQKALQDEAKKQDKKKDDTTKQQEKSWEKLQKQKQKELQKEQKDQETAAKKLQKQKDDALQEEVKRQEKLEALAKETENTIANDTMLSEKEKQEVRNVAKKKQDELKKKSSAMTKQELAVETNAVRAEVKKQIKIRREANAKMLADKANNARKWQKRVQGGFQVQQSIEDFSYAGFKGLSNNVAFLMSQMAGPVGLIGLVGLASYQIYKMTKGAEEAAEATRRMKKAEADLATEMERRLQVTEDLVKANFDMDARDSKGLDKRRDAVKELVTAEAKLAAAKKNQGGNLQDFKDLKKQRDAVSSAFYSEVFQALQPQDNPQDVAKNRKEREELWQQWKRLNEQIETARENLKNTADDTIPQLEKEVKLAEDRVKTAERLIQLEQERDNKLSAIQQREEAMLATGLRKEDIASDYTDILNDEIDALSDRFDKFSESQRKAFDDTFTALQDKIAETRSQLDSGMFDNDQAGRASAEQKIADLIQDQVDAYQDMVVRVEATKRAEQARIDANLAHLNALDQVKQKEAEIRSELEASISATKSLIEAAMLRAQALREAKADSQNSFTDKVYDMKHSMVSNQAQKQIEAIQKQAEAAKKYAEYQNQFLPSQFQQMATNKIEAQANALIAKVKKQEEAIQGQISQKQYDELNKIGDTAKKKAFDAASKGEAEIAQKLLERAGEFYQKAQDMLFEKANTMGMGEGQAFFEKYITKSQGKISGLFDDQMAIEGIKEKAEKAALQALQTQLKSADQIKAQLESRQAVSQIDINNANQLVASLQQALQLKQQIEGAQNVSQSPLGLNVPGKASGGPIQARQPYLVGEEGPELIFPDRSGYVANMRDSQRIMGMSFMPHYGGQSGSGGNVSQVTHNYGGITVNQPSSQSVDDLMRVSAKRARLSRARRK